MNVIPHRTLGRGGPSVSALGLGCFSMTGAYGPSDDAEAIATIRRAFELGVNFFDTAEAYGPFTNEVLVAKALSVLPRDEVVIATKFGWKIEGEKLVGVDSRLPHIREVVDASLERLGVEYVDVLYQHRVDPTVPIEDVVGVMAECVSAGKVRYLGLSEASASTLRRAQAVHPIAALQSEYSLWERGVEEKILPTCRELGIGFVPFSPLGRGFLTGDASRSDQYGETDFRRNDPRFQGENFDANMRAASIVREIASAHGASPAQVALAWLLGRGNDIVPIPGTRRRTHLEDNLGAIRLTLSSDEIARLDSSINVAGARYGAAGLSYLDRT